MMLPRPFPPLFDLDILYSFVIIISSLMIYFATKEMYDLSSHRGLKYFRLTFLFFAFAYFFRSFSKLLIVFFHIPPTFEFSFRAIGAFSLFAFMYFGVMAIFYLMCGVMSDKWKNEKINYIFHMIAVILGFITVALRHRLIVFGINLILMMFVAFVVYSAYKKSLKRKMKSKLFAIYALLLVFWILNIIDILLPDFFALFQLIIYLVSTLLFLLMLYKVLRRIGSG